MSMGTSISPEQEARAVLMARLTGLRKEAILKAEDLTEALSDLSASQVRGLVNALGIGPGRRTAGARRGELARFLAWRAHRSAGEGASWVNQVRQAITSLEERCTAEVGEERRKREGFWRTHAATLEAGEVWLQMEVLETFLHALERRVMSPRGRESEQ